MGHATWNLALLAQYKNNNWLKYLGDINGNIVKSQKDDNGCSHVVIPSNPLLIFSSLIYFVCGLLRK